MTSPRRPLLLHLTHRLPYPPDKGDRIRTFHTLRLLARHARIHLASFTDEPVREESLNGLREYCEKIVVVPVGWFRWARGVGSLVAGGSATTGLFRSPALRRLLKEWNSTDKYDIALASSSGMAPYLPAASPGVRAVVDLVDVDSQKWFDYAAASRWPKSWLYRLEGRRLRLLEKNLPAHATVVLTTPAEVALFEGFAGPGTAVAAVNGVDLDFYKSAPASHEPACCFVGALDYRPNVEGIVWFCQAIWPKILERRGDARLYIVGRNPVTAVKELARVPGVEVAADVPDVRPWLNRAQVVVVPLRIARGVQNKVLEALAMARPVVASRTCLQGLAVEMGRDLLDATTPEHWRDRVLELLADAAARSRLGAAGRAFVEKHHEWESCLQPLLAACGLASPEWA